MKRLGLINPKYEYMDNSNVFLIVKCYWLYGGVYEQTKQVQPELFCKYSSTFVIYLYMLVLCARF